VCRITLIQSAAAHLDISFSIYSRALSAPFGCHAVKSWEHFLCMDLWKEQLLSRPPCCRSVTYCLLRGCIIHAHAQLKIGCKYMLICRHMVQNVHRLCLEAHRLKMRMALHSVQSKFRKALPCITIPISSQPSCQLSPVRRSLPHDGNGLTMLTADGCLTASKSNCWKRTASLGLLLCLRIAARRRTFSQAAGLPASRGWPRRRLMHAQP
jgi:hypothetical protein